MDATRRQWLGAAGLALGSGILGGALARPAAGEGAAGPRAMPWPYQSLEPQAVADRAWAAYQTGHCMYGAFQGLLGECAAVVGEPYRSFPAEIMRFGAGGVAGWGTLCGCLNGAAAFLYLASPDPDPLVDELFWWYSSEKLPDYVPAGASLTILPSVANSPLCHVSVSKWCAASGLEAFTEERVERCGRLAAAVARKTAELLNQQVGGKFVALHPAPPEVEQCRSCHDRRGEVENTRGKMACGECHPGVEARHAAAAPKPPKT